MTNAYARSHAHAHVREGREATPTRLSLLLALRSWLVIQSIATNFWRILQHDADSSCKGVAEARRNRLEYNRKWKAEHLERHRESARRREAERRATDPEWAEHQRALGRKNDATPKRLARHRERMREYKKTPKGKEMVRRQNQRRRSLKAGVACDLTQEQWDAVVGHYNGRCAYCGEKPKVLTLDHVIPLSKGGATTMRNVVPACLECNSSKHVREGFTPSKGVLLL